MGLLKCLSWLVLGIVDRLIQILVQLTWPWFWFNYGRQKGSLPPVKNPLLLKSATSLAKMIRSKQVASVEVVQAFIDQIQAVNPSLNAVVATRFSEALVEAQKVDDLLNSAEIPEQYSKENAPFLGVPFTAKEAFGVVGMPNTSGLMCRKNVKADQDAAAVSAMRRAGAIPIALTNCSELCMWYESSNLLYGRTNNAYHQGRIVGGSSGGEGCILSAAGSACGIGSDIGGSIRMPSYFNGIFGHKPTVGVVDNTGQFPNAKGEVQTYLSTGPMCRFASDLAPLLKVMAGSTADHLHLDQHVQVKKIKFYYMEDDGGSYFISKVDPQIKDAMNKVLNYLEDKVGATVERVNIRKLQKSFFIWACKMQTGGNDTFGSLMGGGKPVWPLWELARWFMMCPRHTLPAIGLGIGEKIENSQAVNERLRKACESLKEEFAELLGDNGVFLYPTHPVVAPYHNQPILMICNFAYTAIFNVLGLPVTACPVGLSKEGVPLGLQVVGNLNQDHLNLAVAEVLDRAFGGWVPPFRYEGPTE